MEVLALFSLVLVLVVLGGQRTASGTNLTRRTDPVSGTGPYSEMGPCSGTGSCSEMGPYIGTGPYSKTEPCSETELLDPKELPGEVISEDRPDEDMQQYLQRVTVRFQGAQYVGSGVVWSVEEDVLVIATAAHVITDNSPVFVQFEQGEPLETQLRKVSDQVDLAFVEIPLLELDNRGIGWQVAKQEKDVCDRLEPGQPLWIMGSVEEAADRVYAGSVIQPWIYLEDFGNYMLLGHAYAVPGVSGGGVFTQDGILVGILCGGNDDDQTAVLPWSVMVAGES